MKPATYTQRTATRKIPTRRRKTAGRRRASSATSFSKQASTWGGEQKSIWIGYPTPVCVHLPKSNFAPVPKISRSSAVSPPFARRKHLRNGVPRQPSLKRFLAPSYPASAVRNANGSRARKSSGRASAGITGIHSKLADYARDARINGNTPDVSSVEQCLRISNGYVEN